MTRAWAGAIVAIALATGLFLRFGRLDARPMHHDEANQAVKFGTLLETGRYQYDFHDHHGPTLYYLTLPAAWVRGQHTLASLDERTLRGVTATFGLVTILLLPLMTAGIGRTAVAAGALLLAVSPAMVFYSRMFIQESLFACFTLWFVIALGRAMTGGGQLWAALAGVAAGLAISTKETSIIVLPAAIVSSAISLLWRRDFNPALQWQRDNAELAGSAGRAGSAGLKARLHVLLSTTRGLKGGLHVLLSTTRGGGALAPHVLVALASAAAVAALFYSSFLTNPAGVLQPLLGTSTYFGRGTQPASHAHPWNFYVSLLTYSASGGLRWSEGLVIALALVGLGTGLKSCATGVALERCFWTRYLAIYVALTMLIFSALPYKTPWNVLPFYVVAIVLAGVGFAWLLSLSASSVWRVAIAVAFIAASAQLGWQAWRASVTYAADPRNPYVYA